jgi:hypothetical protein
MVVTVVVLVVQVLAIKFPDVPTENSKFPNFREVREFSGLSKDTRNFVRSAPDS